MLHDVMRAARQVANPLAATGARASRHHLLGGCRPGCARRSERRLRDAGIPCSEGPGQEGFHRDLIGASDGARCPASSAS